MYSFSTLARSRLDLYTLRRIACDTPLCYFSLLNVSIYLSSSVTLISEIRELVQLGFLFGVGLLHWLFAHVALECWKMFFFKFFFR